LRVFRAIRKQEYALMQLMMELGDSFAYKNEEDRNVIMYSIIRKDKKMFQFFKDNLFLDEGGFLEECDVYGRNSEYYIREAGWSLED